MRRVIAIFMLAFLAGCMAPDRIAYGPKAAATASIEGFGDIRIYADTSRNLPEVLAWLPIPRHKEINYLYLLGTEKLEQVNQADVEEAVRLLTRAVELDPGLARAWVELSHSHGVLIGFGVEADKNRALSAEAAERAVQLDPSDAEAHAVYAMILGDRGEFERAKAEFDTALRLAPGQFEVLTFYIDWASTFGEPERTAELVNKAVSLNPGFPMWSARIFTHAYFMAGRYEDALRMLDRLTPENYGRKHWVMRSGALAALGRTEEAKVSVTDALRRFPNLTVEGFVNIPGFNEAERQRLIETMQLVGFPDCAKAAGVCFAVIALTSSHR